MRTYSWLNSKLKVRNSKLGGLGVFAQSDIEKGTRLAVFGGVVLTLQQELELPEEYQDTGLQIAENLVLTTKEQKEDTDCFNHSCNPNAGFKGQIFLTAMKDIFAGEEVTFDYAMVLFDGDNSVPYSLDCACGAENCRGVITTEDWKKPELQERYRGFFQQHIAEKIDRNQ